MTLEERRIIWNKRKEARRKQQIRKIGYLSALIVLPILCIVMSVLIFSKTAKAKEDKTYYKYYTSYEIKPGDTLYAIAEQYMEGYSSKEEYVRELKQTNGIRNIDSIRAGQIIHVPYYSTVFQ